MSRKLNILHTLAGLKNTAGGSRHATTSLCEALGKQGLNVHIISQDDAPQDDLCVLPDPKHVKTHLLKLRLTYGNFQLYYTPYFSRTVQAVCKKQAIQIIHDNGMWLPCNHSSASTARDLRIPLVIHPHGMLNSNAMNFHAWKKRIAWKIYQRRDIESAKLFVASSEPEAESIRQIGFNQPIAIIPHGISLPSLDVKRKDNKIHKAIFLSRIHPIKGLLNLVLAWSKVRPSNWEVIIAGPDEENHRSEVEKAIDRERLSDTFIFVGPAYGSEKKELYRKADLFILPSLSENFGLVIAEALSYEVPVITTHGAPWQGLLTNKCGWWVEVGAQSLAQAIQEAVTLSDKERHEMGKRGRNFVANEFSWELVAGKMVSVYEWLLGIGPKPSCVVEN